jgi:hypothetical protein
LNSSTFYSSSILLSFFFLSLSLSPSFSSTDHVAPAAVFSLSTPLFESLNPYNQHKSYLFFDEKSIKKSKKAIEIENKSNLEADREKEDFALIYPRKPLSPSFIKSYEETPSLPLSSKESSNKRKLISIGQKGDDRYIGERAPIQGSYESSCKYQNLMWKQRKNELEMIEKERIDRLLNGEREKGDRFNGEMGQSTISPSVYPPIYPPFPMNFNNFPINSIPSIPIPSIYPNNPPLSIPPINPSLSIPSISNYAPLLPLPMPLPPQ